MHRFILTTLFALVIAATSILAEVPNPRRESPPGGIEDRAVAVGTIAPDFTLEAAQGEDWVLSAALARGPVVLVFYRGDW